MTMDLFATIAEIAGAKCPANIDAFSFLSTLVVEKLPDSSADSRVLAERDLYFVRREGGPQYGGKTIEALIRGDWKLVQDSPFQPLELYNLKTDPQESNNRARDEKEVLQRLSAAMRKHIQNGGQVAWQAPAE